MPRDMFGDFDEAEDETEDEDQSEQPEADSVEARRALLTTMAGAGLGEQSKLAAELLVALEERETKKAETEAALGRLEDGLEGGLDFTNPAVLDDLRLAEVQKRASADAAVLLGVRKVMQDSGFSREDVERQVEEYRANQALLAEFEVGSDALDSSPVWIAHLADEAGAAASLRLAQEEKANRPGAWDDAVADAQAGYDAEIDRVLAEA